LEQADRPPPAGLQAAAQALHRVLEERLVRVGVQRAHAAAVCCVRQALDGVPAVCVRLALQEVRGALVKDAKGSAGEVAGMLRPALLQALHVPGEALARIRIGEEVPCALLATLQRLAPAAQGTGAGLVAEALPNGGAELRNLGLVHAVPQVLDLLALQHLDHLAAALLRDAEKLAGHTGGVQGALAKQGAVDHGLCNRGC